LLTEGFFISLDDFGDEVMAAIRFGEEFSARYGQPHPHFFPGSLDQAIRESCLQPAKDVSFNYIIAVNLFLWHLASAKSYSSFRYELIF
jgi:hypothetical protein